MVKVVSLPAYNQITEAMKENKKKVLEEKAKSTLTPVVISNMDEIKELIKLSGSVTVGETPVIRIKK